MTAVRFVLVGASDIASTRVAPAIKRCGHDLVAVVSTSQQHGQAFARSHEIESASSDLEAVLARDDVDAVYISSTNEQHHAQALAAAAAGKHVLCEKPMAMTLEQAWEVDRACQDAGVVLAVNHHMVAAGTHEIIARLVREGAVGEPLAVRVFHAVELVERLRGWRLTSPDRGAGVIFDLTSHTYSLVNAILDRRAIDATAVAVSQGAWDSVAEDAVMSVVRYEGDVLVQAHDAFTVPSAGAGLEVHGSEGSLFGTNVMSQDPVGQVTLRTRDEEHTVDVPHREGLYERVVKAFVAATRNEGEVIVDGAAGARALAVTLAVKQAAEDRRLVEIDWDEPHRG